MVASEFSRVYEALLSGEPLALEPPPRHAAYIEWLRARDAAATETYWRKGLAGFEVPTAVAGLRTAVSERSAAPDYQSREIELPARLVEGLEGLAADARVTVNTVMLGAWSLLLSAYSGEDDVVFGTTVSGRPPEIRDVQSMVGLLINTLPLRVRLGDESLDEWLRRLQALHAEQMEYQHSPLWKVQQWSAVPAGTPLFARQGIPRSVDPDDFATHTLQRPQAGQGGLQVFFHEGDRAFCLYVVIGSHRRRRVLTPVVNQVLRGLRVA